MKTGTAQTFVALAALHAAAAFAAGQETGADAVPPPDPAAGTEVRADRVEYFRRGSAVRASGGVVISNEIGVLSADRVIVQTETGDMWGYGNITFVQSNRTWSGTSLYCNARSGRVVCKGESELVADPFRVKSRSFAKEKDRVLGFESEATTCNIRGPGRHYYLSADTAVIVPGESLSAEHVFFHLWGIPVLYTPYWRTTKEGYGLTLKPGYSERMGAYLLTGYNYGIGDEWSGTTHVDYRARRGMALGQDFRWKDDARMWEGESVLYGLHDKNPVSEDFPQYKIGSGRYRLFARHTQNITDRWLTMLRAHYVSDPQLLQDFFNSEYRVEPQTVNYVSLRYRGDGYSAGLAARPRLNNFYEAVTRVPEGYVRVQAVQIMDTPLYYESGTTAGKLQKLWPVWETNLESYAAARMDSRHVLFYDWKAGFLNIEPRVAYRGTYYSATRAGADGGAPGRAAFRSLAEFGAEASFKAFRVIRDAEGETGGLRHMIRPYANYTYIPDPSVDAGRLWRFDSIDELGRKHSIRLGAVNKMQTLREMRPFDLVEVDMWTDGNLDPEPGKPMFETAALNSEIRPYSNVAVDCDAVMSLAGGGLSQFNTHLMLGTRKSLYGDVEYRYAKDSSSLVGISVEWSPGERWTHTVSARYEFDQKRLQEYKMWVQRNYDCMSWALGFSHVPAFDRTDGSRREAEYQVMFRMWLTAFPQIGVALE